jgi:sugar O-acyltransferase (sialic acid O-acetyltransferase NeuD family)
MSKKLIIFGAGKIAQAASYFFNRDSGMDIAAYCCDKEYVQADSFLGKPLLAAEDVPAAYAPDEHLMFVALGYQGMNDLRANKVEWAKDRGYALASYRSPLVPGDYVMGENSIVMDGAAIQPCVTLGRNVFVWGGAMIGHHAVIQDHCWITGGCAIGGVTTVGEKAFVGLNATLGHEIAIGRRCMIGANALVNKSLPDGSVLIVRDTEPHRLNSDQFSRMSRCFNLG